MKGLARAAARFFLPSVCLSCKTRPADDLFRGGVCAECWDSLPVPAAARCNRCDEALPGASDPARCGRCLLDPPDFERLRAAAAYRGCARQILLAFKFQGADYLGPRMAAVIARRLGSSEVDEVAAVPATPGARRARGYHPAEVLAAALARRLDLPFAVGRLVKVRDTEIQSRLPAARRGSNVRGAFQARGTPGRRVLLVDDVATSAATARECARELALGGASAVTVWCFARASRTDIDPEAD